MKRKKYKFLCPECCDENLYYHKDDFLFKVGTCDKCRIFRYVEQVFKKEK
jgi:hypothetical protein